jgi:hypothetical protein
MQTNGNTTSRNIRNHFGNNLLLHFPCNGQAMMAHRDLAKAAAAATTQARERKSKP